MIPYNAVKKLNEATPLTPVKYLNRALDNKLVEAARTEALARVYAAALVNGTIPPREAVQNFINLMSGQ